MKRTFNSIIKILEKMQRNSAGKHATSAVAVVLVFVTVYSLIIPAITLDRGAAAQMSGTDAGAEFVLACDYDVHKHTEDCFEERPVFDASGNQTGTEKVLICGKEDYAVHEHDENCYQMVTRTVTENGAEKTVTEKILVCSLPEIKEHKHTKECYEEQMVLTCGKEEQEAHKHTDACYQESRELVCQKEEHIHDDGCYSEIVVSSEKILKCGYQEGQEISPAVYSDPVIDEETDEVLQEAELVQDAVIHYHSDDCYETVEKTERQLTCGKAEHQHSDKCYSVTRELVCGIEETNGHKHTNKCYTKEKVAVCGQLELHTHTIDCYEKGPKGESPEKMGWVRYEEDAEGNKILVGDPRYLICGKTELLAHQHDAKCFHTEEEAVTIAEVQEMAEPTEEKAASEAEAESNWYQLLDNEVPLTETQEESETKAPAETQTQTEPQTEADAGQTVLTSLGEGYSVKIICSADSGIPADAGLVVREIEQKAAFGHNVTEYETYEKKAAKVLGREAGSLSYARIFDISIVDREGNEIQPAPGTTVSVQIALADADVRSEALRVVHFADKSERGDVVNNVIDGQTVSFEAEGFSVYAVVDESTGENARMKLEFYSGDNLIATMYVKNSDELLGDGERDPYKQYVEDVIHDPGVGVLESGEVFAGWILDKSSYTTADIDDAMTIEQIRQWAVSQNITEGVTEHRFDAAICKLYTITYKDEDGTILGMDSVPVKSGEYGTAAVDESVNMAYSPKDDVHNFEGWTLDSDSDENVTSTIPDDRIYENGSSIKIKGDISFTVNAPAGNWLIFDENGKGGTYNAPQFVKSGEVTARPRPDGEMTRNGYTFGGWYSEVSGTADEHGYKTVVESSRYTFGYELDAKTTLYAKWIPNTRAPYTVVFWGQNVERDGYEVLGSYSNDNGIVGQSIPYAFVENKDEDYVTGVGADNGHYTGFCLNDSSKNQEVTITPEGDAVLNLYYDRIMYHFKFYLYRDGTNRNRYDYANNSAGGSSLDGLVSWHSNQTAHPSVTGYTIQDEVVGGRTYHYFVMDAYYGEDISAKWPKYNQIIGANNREAVSFVMMVGTALKPNPSSGGDGTVKGIITVMNENILGATNDANGNYIVIRFPDNYYNWRYHIWFETVDGEDYTGMNTHTWNGKTYYEIEDSPIIVRSSNTTVTNQNAPKYEGFEFVDWRGNNAQWSNRNYWTTGNNPTLYHINEIYKRLSFNISYFDGNYVNGDGDQIQNRASHLLHESIEIPQGAVIADAYKNYVPDPTEEGYVFAGWYLDEACTVPYTWRTMPIGGIVVYAKWIQEEYRVFLHPNAGTDPNLDWGAENVSTSFRVSYGEKVSTPTGKRPDSGYEFVGWYTNPSMSSQYLYNSDIVLNDETVTTPYNKTEDTERDKWGNPTQSGNKDKDPNLDGDYSDERTWITKKLDLYAKWRKILEGAGINVVYTADDGKGHVGEDAPKDEVTYPDKAEATAQAADKPPADMYFKCWVIQTWNEEHDNGDGTYGAYEDTEVTVLPGEQFTVDELHARKEEDPNHPGEYKYTMQLRAEYEEPGDNQQTHIWWFENYAADNEERHNSSRQDENISVNETVGIESAPTRYGYTFLGWARIPKTTSGSAAGTDGNPPTGKVLELNANDLYLKYENGEFKLNDSSSADNGKTVTKVAADEKQDYHDMYAVWDKKKYTVTVIKETPGVTHQNIPFQFTPAGFPDSVETGSSDFWLVGNPSGAEVDDEFYPHSKVFENVPYGTQFTITETVGDYIVSVKYDCTDADDTAKNVSNQETENGGQITVDGNITVTFTNTLKEVPLKVVKIDQSGKPLAGASFEGDLIEGGSITTSITGSGDDAEAVIINDEAVPLGEYTITETEAPAGYLPLEGDIVITIADNAAGTDIDVSAMIGETEIDIRHIKRDPDTGLRTIEIMNTAGVELPSTGGPGTRLIYLTGSMLMALALAGLLLVRRRNTKM